LAFDDVPADQEERLTEAEVGGRDRSTGRGPRAAAEGIEDGARSGRVGDLDSAGPGWTVGIPIADLRDVRDNIRHLVGGEGTRQVMGEESRVVLVARDGGRGEAIGL